jgi:hypothetical protein
MGEDGQIQDPRMNKFEEYGILISYKDEDGLKAKSIMYIKDDISKYYTANTPVTFHEEKVTLTGKTEEGKEIRFQCDIATNVRIREAMKEHPVIEKPNNCAVKALDRYLGEEDC